MDAAQALTAGLAAGFAVAVPLGAIGTLVSDLGLRRGTGAALAAGMGVATVDGLYAAAAALFGASLASSPAPARETIRVVAAGLLAAVALVLLRAAVRRRRADAVPIAGAVPPPRRLYGRFVALTCVNPTTAATFAAVTAGLPAAGGDNLGGAAGTAFVAGAFAASATWHAVLATASGAAGRRLPPAVAWWTGVAAAVLTLALAARLALGR